MKIKKGDLVKYGPQWTDRIEGRHHWRGIAISEVSLEDFSQGLSYSIVEGLSYSIETVLVRWYKGGSPTMEFRENLKYLKVLDKAS